MYLNVTPSLWGGEGELLQPTPLGCLLMPLYIVILSSICKIPMYQWRNILIILPWKNMGVGGGVAITLPVRPEREEMAAN